MPSSFAGTEEVILSRAGTAMDLPPGRVGTHPAPARTSPTSTGARRGRRSPVTPTVRLMAPGGGALSLAATRVHDGMDPTWPPVLVALVVGLLIGAVIVATMMSRRFRDAARSDHFGPDGRRR